MIRKKLKIKKIKYYCNHLKKQSRKVLELSKHLSKTTLSQMTSILHSRDTGWMAVLENASDFLLYSRIYFISKYIHRQNKENRRKKISNTLG